MLILSVSFDVIVGAKIVYLIVERTAIIATATIASLLRAFIGKPAFGCILSLHLSVLQKQAVTS